MEVSPQVHAGPSVGTGQGLALLLAPASWEDILPKIFRQQEVPVHMHVLEAACKGCSAQLDGAEPSKRRGRGCGRSLGHGAGGHAELGRAALMPEPQRQGLQAECHLRSVPAAIV